MLYLSGVYLWVFVFKFLVIYFKRFENVLYKNGGGVGGCGVVGGGR